MSAIETFEVEDLTVKIHVDDDPESPREWDNPTTLVCWHSRYNLGDRQPESHEREALERGGLPLLARYLRLCYGALAVRPLGLIDHSSISMWVGGGAHWCDPQGWDSGTVGFAYIDAEGQKLAWGESTPPEGWADEAIEADVGIYDQYLRGDVYGFVIEDAEGEWLDSCWGHYGFDYAVEEAKSQAEWLVKARRENADQEAREREHWANHDLSTEVTR